MSDSDLKLLTELLAGNAIGDLTEYERIDLDRLKEQLPNEASKLSREFETAASAIQCIGATNGEALPSDLANSIRESGYQAIVRNQVSRESNAAVSAKQPSASTPQAAQQADAALAEPARMEAARSGSSKRELLAWAVTAAALLACVGLWTSSENGLVKNNVVANVGELRSDLLRSPTATSVSWANGSSPFANAVSGDVVWSTERQQGVMRFVDMPINDPTVEQYQLWIIDPERDDEPIDGGVFDITSDGEVLVSIDAKLNVVSPQAFAITIEKPGGVVVSNQERLPLLAAVASNG